MIYVNCIVCFYELYDDGLNIYPGERKIRRECTEAVLSNYEERSRYILEDFDEFLNEGLSISQVAEKLLEEYDRGIVNSKIEKLVIYLKIALHSIERHNLREDIGFELISMINELDSIPIEDEVGAENTKLILLDIEKFINKFENTNKTL